MSRILTLLLLISLNCNSQVSLHDYYSLRILNDKNLSNVQKSVSNDSFIISTDKKSIDPSILNFLTKLNKKTFQLANPDQSYNATDNVDESLPNRQLRLLFKAKNACFIEYAHGGIGFHYHIAWFELKNNKVTDFWICNSNREVKNILELKKFIKSFDRRITLRDGRKIKSNRLCF
jgi:hypothetical protein